ncbi:g7358 [Coccomyxa viridis]|uniref:G7358 protein n=1 Tax=Coccomyxa viridis TaxID=1274662 RepID=A0ABP1G1Q0_9CHLO
MDLPEGLLTTILKQLPLQSKIHAQAVCRMFRDVLCNPAQGSSVWDSIHLEDPVFEAASPTALAGWLMQRARGIQLLQYTPGPRFMGRAEEVTTPDMRRKQDIIRDVVLKVAAQLSPEAAIEMDLTFASAETLFGSQEPELPRPHKDGMFTTYWASLAGNLTRLKLSFGHPVGGATISPLSQLTRLQSLSLQLNCWYADVELSLPQLKELEMVAVQHAWITLRSSSRSSGKAG